MEYAATGSDAIVETLSSIIYFYISRCKDTKSFGKLVEFRREISNGTQMELFCMSHRKHGKHRKGPSQMAVESTENKNERHIGGCDQIIHLILSINPIF